MTSRVYTATDLSVQVGGISINHDPKDSVKVVETDSPLFLPCAKITLKRLPRELRGTQAHRPVRCTIKFRDGTTQEVYAFISVRLPLWQRVLAALSFWRKS